MTTNPPTTIDWLADICRYVWSRERNGFASKSEMRRWCRSGAVRINGITAKEMDRLPLPVTSLVLFPNARSRTTIK